jgi:hypothetical protein
MEDGCHTGTIKQLQCKNDEWSQPEMILFRASQSWVELVPVGLDGTSHRLKIDFLNKEQ